MNGKKRVATITFHYAFNYGSKLQAYALQTALEQLGCDARILNYIYDFDAYTYKLFHWSNYGERPKRFFRDLLTLPTKAQRKRSYRQFDDRYLKLTEEHHAVEELARYRDQFDVFIAGSDQIWNTDCTCRVVPAYFLSFAADSAARKVAYAPSIAHDTIKEQYFKEFTAGLENFDVLSVREETGCALCREMTDKPVAQMSDPVVLLPASSYRDIERPVSGLERDKFIFVYALEPSEEIVTATRRLAERYGLKIAHFSEYPISPYGRGAKNIFTKGPCEFLWLVDNARFVVTNSFHATAFSVIFGKRFMTFTTQRSGSRMIDFLKKFNLSDRVNGDWEQIDSQELDSSETHELLELERQRCLAFLRRAIG